MKRIAWLLITLSALALFAGCAAKGANVNVDLDAAKKALADAKQAQADTLCPDEFQSAEMRLKQTELLIEDEQDDQASLVAQQTVNLAQLAAKCAAARQAYNAEAIEVAGVAPAALLNFKTSVYFGFNSNAIDEAERAKLDEAIAFLRAQGEKYTFYILLTAYTDAPGSPDANMELSKQRALVTRYYLTKNGLARGRIYMRAMGEAAASKSGGNTTGSEHENPELRRVDVTVLMERPVAASFEPSLGGDE